MIFGSPTGKHALNLKPLSTDPASLARCECAESADGLWCPVHMPDGYPSFATHRA